MFRRFLAVVLTAAVTVSGFGGGRTTELKVSAAEENQEINELMKLWYRTPANIQTAENSGGEWMQESLPLGNGNLGNLIFGGISKERIHFNEKTLWTGGPSSSRPNYQFGNKSTAYTAAEIEEYRQILDDKSTDVFHDSMSGYGYVPIRFPGENNLNKGSYQDFGDIWLDFGAMGITDTNVDNYRRELDLQTGIASTSFSFDGVDYQREHFVSYPDQVMVTNLTASKAGKLNVTICMELNNSNLSGTTSFDEQNHRCTIVGTVTDNGLKFRTTMQVIPVGGTITKNVAKEGYTVTGADSIRIIMAAETDYKNDYPTYRDREKNLTTVVDGRVTVAAGKSYETLKENHLADHQELFDRVSLDLCEDLSDLPTNELVASYRNGEYSKYLEVLSFQFGRYLTIAGSRGTLPSNLVGLWTVGASAWTGDYHFNVNVQMNYWPVYVTNLAECGTTMVEYMENLREPGRLTAERVHGIEGAVENHTGFVVHTENNPFGMTAPSNAQEYGWNPTGAAWAIQNLWAHYEFTQDEEYLKEMIYPIMKEAANFWDQYLWTSGYQVIHDEDSPYNGQARVVVAPSFSEEQGPTAVGTTYDQSLVWELYKECIEAGRIVGEDPVLLNQWEETMQKLDPIEINETNGIKEWYEETRVGLKNGHNQSYAKAGNLAEIAVPNSGWYIGHPGEQRHASHLVGLYPGTLINKENEAYMNAAIQSLTERGEYSTGWSKANKINLWARTGNGEKAYQLLKNLIGGNSSGLQYNLFDSHGSGGGETMKNGTPVWQIDGNYGLTSGVAEMLLQSQLDYVQFLPAIPAEWSDGEVQGLKARGNFTIGEVWKNGAADEFTVCYEGTQESSEFVGEYPNITKAVVYADGKEIAVEKDLENGRITFEAEAGVVYSIDLPDTVQAYQQWQEVAEEIYYLTEDESFSENELAQIYWKWYQFRDAILAEDPEFKKGSESYEAFQKIYQILKDHGKNAPNFVQAQTAAANWDGYDAALMIDGNSDTRWASKSPVGDVEILLTLEEKSTINAITFEQYVSYRNANDGYEIWAWDGKDYRKICEGTDLGDENDATGTYFASKTVAFDNVRTEKIKVVIKAGYVGEPSFWEIKPLCLRKGSNGAGTMEALDGLIEKAERIDRTGNIYTKIDADLRKAFERAVSEAKKADGLTQIEIDVRENLLNRFYESVQKEMSEVKLVDVSDVFSDVVEADWFKEYIQYVYDYKIMTGMTGTDTFAPNQKITKAQVAQVLYNMQGNPQITDRRVFTELLDIPESAWYANAVAWAYSTGVVTGDTVNRKFSPNADVTREQLAIMMYRYALYCGYKVDQTSDFAGLVGAEKVADWAAPGMKWAVGAGLISGVDNQGVKYLEPQGNATRAQVAAILQRFCLAYQ